MRQWRERNFDFLSLLCARVFFSFPMLFIVALVMRYFFELFCVIFRNFFLQALARARVFDNIRHKPAVVPETSSNSLASTTQFPVWHGVFL